MRYTMFFLCFLFQTGISYSQERNINEAMTIAKSILKCSKLTSVSFNPIDKISKAKSSYGASTNAIPFFIFNDSVSQSFIIISSDSRMKDVLGVSYNSVFNSDDIPCGLQNLLDDYAIQYESLVDKDVEKSTSSVKDYKSVSHLLTSQWEQDSPFNDKSPDGCPCGCVATAMAQIMYYHKYPTQGSGSFSYTSRTHFYYSSFNYSSTAFDWANMVDHYDAFSSSKSRDAVATLVDACGVSVGMDYDTSGSGAYGFDVPYALRTYFKYNDNIAYLNRSYYTSSEWYDLVHKELESSHPILYCGSDLRQGGHAFVIDGYNFTNGKFHVNWGWAGKYDGEYELDALDPGTYEFSSSQCMISGFAPETTGEANDMFYAETFTNNGSFQSNSEINLSLNNVYSFSNKTSYIAENTNFNGMIGIGLYDNEMNFMEVLDSTKVSKLQMLEGYKSIKFECIINWDKLDKSLAYYICPLARATTSKSYTRIRTNSGKYDTYAITYEGKDGGDTPSYKSVLTEDFNSPDFPSEWTQESVQGAGTWKQTLVLTASDDDKKTPTPYEGKGYIYTEYNSGTIFGNLPTVTQLTLPKLKAEADHTYMVSFSCRKYATSPGDNQIVGIYIQKSNGSKYKLFESTIQNSQDWSPIEATFTESGNYNIVIESSIEKEGRLFIDDLKVSVAESTEINNVLFDRTKADTQEIFTISGLKTSPFAITLGNFYIKGGKIYIKEK